MTASEPQVGYEQDRLDPLSPEERSRQMSLVKAKDTKPEIKVRRLVYSLGYRYRLHYSDLPGRPDLVFLGRRKVIFVHGCFWHRHPGCPLARLPKSRPEFWLPKLEENRRRDLRNQAALRKNGWDVLVIWECQLGDLELLKRRITQFLEHEAIGRESDRILER